MRGTTNRQKLSTTVSGSTQEYLESLVETGRATSLAQAVDQAVARARQADARARLERDTAAYFQALSGKASQEEVRLGVALGNAADEVDFEA